MSYVLSGLIILELSLLRRHRIEKMFDLILNYGYCTIVKTLLLVKQSIKLLVHKTH